MLRIGNTTLTLSTSFKAILLLIIVPIAIIIYRGSTYSFDPEEELTYHQKMTYKMWDEGGKKMKEAEADSRRWYHVGTAGYIVMYLFIAAWVLILTDKRIRVIAKPLLRYKLFRIATEVHQEEDLKDEEYLTNKHAHTSSRETIDLVNLRSRAEINMMDAKTDFEKARAELLKSAVVMIDKMSDRWKAYVWASIMGSPGTPQEDKDLKEEIEKEKLRREKMDNDDREDKYRSQKGL